MTDLTVRFPRPHAAQRQMLTEAKRFNVACVGRRSGKTLLSRDRLARAALDGQTAGYFAPTYKVLSETWRGLRSMLAPVTAHVDNGDHRLELVTGGVIEMWSLQHRDAGRSRGYALAVVDEAAFVTHLEEAWNGAIHPTLADRRGSAWFFSTPKGLNYFHTLFLRGADPDWPDWQAWQMPTAVNPYIAPEEIADARKGSGEQWFRQEYLAEFLDMEGSVFRRIQQAATAEPQDGPQDGHTYVFGVDWGKLNDWTVVIILDTTAREVVAMSRFNQIGYQLQLGRLRALYNQWQPQTVIAEANSMGEPLIEQLRNDGLPVAPFHTSNASKAVIIDALALAFDQDDIRIINDPALVSELVAFEAMRLPSGLLRYSAPEGLHDDCVMALALAWSGVGTGGDLLAAYHVVTCACGRSYFAEPPDRPCPSCGRRNG